jgi:hypothetical protein
VEVTLVPSATDGLAGKGNPSWTTVEMIAKLDAPGTLLQTEAAQGLDSNL